MKLLIIWTILILFPSVISAQEWKAINSPTTFIAKIFFKTESKGWIIGNRNAIYYTSDSGNSWEQQRKESDTGITNIFFSDTLNGWCTGGYGLILHTEDGGKTWRQQGKNNNFTLYSIFFINNYGWAVGYQSDNIGFFKNGVILKTTNSGETWYEIPDTTIRGLLRVDFVNEKEGWAAGFLASNDFGGEPYLIHTTDAGNTWQEYYIIKEDRFHGSIECMKFLNKDIGWIAGNNMTLYKTIDGGNRWSWINDHKTINYPYLSISLIDQNNIWLIDYSTIYHTTNGGTDWETKNHFVVNNEILSDIFFPDPKTGFLVSNKGNIWKYAEELSEIKYKDKDDIATLNNNYPNPFNPVTTISYSVPSDGNVKIIIYDALGREITRLLNEHKNTGKYSVQYDASRLASGTYFYRLFIDLDNGEKNISIQRAMQVVK
jgi:photosystem II stability/assembly factor-like uncharacterized protein